MELIEHDEAVFVSSERQAWLCETATILGRLEVG